MSAGSIGFLVYDLRASGVVRNVVRIAAAVRAAGHDARLWPVRPQGDFHATVPEGLPVEPVLPTATGRQRDVDSLLSVRALAQTIEQRRPAILFSGGNQMHLHAALAMRSVPSRKAIRFIGRASNAVVATGHGGLGTLARPFERFQYRSMDRIAAVSEELAGDIVRTFAIDPARVVTIPNGVDVERIAELAAESVDHPFFADDAIPVVVGTGRISRQKNFEALIRAFALARKQRAVRLIVIGPGSAARIEALRKLAASLDVAEDVSIAGYQPNPAAFMRRAALTVVTSRWEGASNVLLEAMACGCPLVALRAPTGIAEVLGDGLYAPLVPQGDDAALAQAMLARIAAPRDSERLVARAQEYSLERTLSAYVDLITRELDHDRN